MYDVIPLELLHQSQQQSEDITTFEQIFDHVQVAHDVSEPNQELQIPLGEPGDLLVVTGRLEGDLESGELLDDLFGELFDEERGHVDMVADVLHDHRDESLLVGVVLVFVVESYLHNLKNLRGESPRLLVLACPESRQHIYQNETQLNFLFISNILISVLFHHFVKQLPPLLEVAVQQIFILYHYQPDQELRHTL